MNLRTWTFVIIAVTGCAIRAESNADEVALALTGHIDGECSKEEETFRITHESDPEQYILITTILQANKKQFAFKRCQIGEPDKCQKIGRYDFYNDNDLQSLSDYFLAVGRGVFWSEATAGVAGILLMAGAYYRNPLAFQQGREEAALESVARPSAAMAMRSSVALVESATSSPVARFAGHVYEKYGQGIIFGFLLNVRTELMEFFSTMTSILTSTLSPAEHYRSVRFIDILRSSHGNIHVRKRDYTSFTEYFSQFHFANLGEISKRIENLLESL